MSEVATASTRAQLIAAAAAMFAEDGYASVSVRDLARRTGMTTGAIYSHFRNKADLLACAIEAIVVTNVQEQLSATPDAPVAPNVTLPAIFADFPRRAALRALLVEGAAAARQDSEVRERLHNEHARHLRWWTDYHRRGQEQGEVASDVDAETLALMLWSIELGLGLLEAMGFAPSSPQAWGRLAGALLTGLALGEP